MPVNRSSRPAPMVNVSFDEAGQFCRNARKLTGWPICLPEEAEWEYACRAGSAVAKRGKSQPNAWGLYEMPGDIWERCAGCLYAYPAKEVLDLDHMNSRWPPFQMWRPESNAARGGDRRTASRIGKTVEGWEGDLGFRVIARLA